MEQRIDIQHAQPEAWKAMYNLAGMVSRSGLSAIQKHLISVRTSQVNSCAYCINMHTEEALKSGETQQRLFLLSAWRETDIFSDEEKALLAMTEEITLIHQSGLTDATYSLASRYFSEEQLSATIMSIVMMNAWNRIAISTRIPVGH